MRSYLSYGYNLKKGLEEGRKEGRKEGMEQGVKAFIEICKENSLAKETVSDKLMEQFSLSAEATKEFMGKYWMMESKS